MQVDDIGDAGPVLLNDLKSMYTGVDGLLVVTSVIFNPFVAL